MVSHFIPLGFDSFQKRYSGLILILILRSGFDQCDQEIKPGRTNCFREMKKKKSGQGNEMGYEEEDVHRHLIDTPPPPPRKLVDDHPCVPRKLRSAVIKRNHEESTSPTLPEAKKSFRKVKRIKLKKDVPKKRSRKQSTAMPAPITKDEEEVVATLNSLAEIFSAASSPPPPPPPPASSSSPHHTIPTIAIDTTPIQFQSSPNSIINTTATQEPIIQTDENKGVLLEPLAVKEVLPYSSITRVSTTDDKKTLRKRCATHVYISHFIKVSQDGKRDEETTSRTLNSHVSQNPKLDLLSMSVRGGMEASGSNNKRSQSVVYPEDHYMRSPFIDQIRGNVEQQVRQQQFSTTGLRWQGGGTEPGISPQMLFSRTTRPSLSSSGYQDKSATTFLRDIPLSLQLLCTERP